MNSSSIVNSYANNNSMLYGAHYITLMSDIVTYEKPTGKFIFEYITPNASTEIFDKALPKNSTGNIVNKSDIQITSITSSNYIELNIPKYLFYIEDVIVTHPSRGTVDREIKRKEYKKGQKFVAINIGGNIDSPYIIGVVE